MIVLGDISGIQSYLFDVAESGGGGQAQRLRARSFFLQLLAEVAAIRVLHALRWPLDRLRLSGAGKFLLAGSTSAQTESILAGQQREINAWLLNETRAELRLTLAWHDSELTVDGYSSTLQKLQQLKARPWAPESTWNPAQLILPALDTPCALCGHAPAQQTERDPDDGTTRRVCQGCFSFRKLGRQLPRARWLTVRERPQTGDLEILGLGIAVSLENSAPQGSGALAVANLQHPESRPPSCPNEQFIERRLMAHVPTDEHGAPLDFAELASRAQGDALLAVLKADADSLGLRFQQLMNTSGFEGMAELSRQLDRFFSGRLRRELAAPGAPGWQSIYTIFAGGDDLVMVGPWDVMVEFAGTMRGWFQQEFRNHGLTLSAGLAFIQPNRPIKFAVGEAEELLELAKHRGKDRLAAFGQVWEWSQHSRIFAEAKQLVGWVTGGKMQRGWLHTLLQLVEVRHGAAPDHSATSRLAWHVSRNYRSSRTRDRAHGNDVFDWGQELIAAFDDPAEFKVRYLPAMLRYALTATRSPNEE